MGERVFVRSFSQPHNFDGEARRTTLIGTTDENEDVELQARRGVGPPRRLNVKLVARTRGHKSVAIPRWIPLTRHQHNAHDDASRSYMDEPGIVRSPTRHGWAGDSRDG